MEQQSLHLTMRSIVREMVREEFEKLSHTNHIPLPKIAQHLRRIGDLFLVAMTDRDKRFIESLKIFVNDTGFLTQKQEHVLDEIYDRYICLPGEGG